MKYIFPLLFLFLAFACTSPQQSLEAGAYETAFQQSAKKIQRGNIKTQITSVFQIAFDTLQQRDLRKLEALTRRSQPDDWPRIYELAQNIKTRQQAISPVLEKALSKGQPLAIDTIPIDNLLKESEQKSAIYCYARAQELVPLARSRQQKAAQQAFYWLEKCQQYQRNFKDAAELQTEMRKLGTSNILIQPIYGQQNEYLSGLLFEELFGNQKFPLREKWQVYHLQQPSNQVIDFRLDLTFTDFRSSGNDFFTATCYNNLDIENGFTTRQEWSVVDSAWIEVQVPLYFTVTAIINTFEQYKSADLSLQYRLYDLHRDQLVEREEFQEFGEWQNVYSTWSGDERARYGTCEFFNGFWQDYPLEEDLFSEAASKIRWSFFAKLEEPVVN